MGDSAGAGLVLCLLLRLRDAGTPLPCAAVAMSPWTDLALTGASLTENAPSDPMLNARDLPSLVYCYLAGADPQNPYASPLYGDVSGLPPVLIQVGSDEILRDDAVRMAEKLKIQNAESRLEIWPRMPHVFSSSRCYLKRVKPLHISDSSLQRCGLRSHERVRRERSAIRNTASRRSL